MTATCQDAGGEETRRRKMRKKIKGRKYIQLHNRNVFFVLTCKHSRYFTITIQCNMYCYAACTVYKVVIVIAYMSGPVNCRYYSTSGPAIIRKLPLLDDIETTKCSTETMTYRQTDRHTNKQTVKGSNFQFIFSLFPSISTSFSLPCFTLTETHSLLGLQ